jgi:hypothetical protein
VLAVAGAGIMLMIGGEHRGPFGVSDPTSKIIEDLQFTTGEGPCIDAFNSGQPVLEPDLTHPSERRWPAFSGPAIDAGVGAVFGFPIANGPVRLGALDVYLDHAADLTSTQRADAVTLTEVISRTVLAIQANAAPGVLADQFETIIEHRAVVHQAAGMLSAQIDIPVSDALARIRAHAYAEDKPVNDVAQDIVQRQLHLQTGPDS